jgi:hypothetical protein
MRGDFALGTESISVPGGGRIRVGGMVSDRLDHAAGARLSTGVLPTDHGETIVQLNNLHYEVTDEDLEVFYRNEDCF